MKEIVLIVSFLVLFESLSSGQDAKFGGPFTTISFNKQGASVSAGGGGTFFVKNRYYIGIFGQGTTDAIKRYGGKGHENLLLKSRQTGFWLGYKHNFDKVSRIGISAYNKVGFGQVYLNNPDESINYYDKSIVFTPNVELLFRITNFFEVGLAVYYEFFTGVDLIGYSKNDFNSFGGSILLKFKKLD